MTEKAQLLERIREVVESLADCPEDSSAPLDVDSLTLVQIVEELEVVFDIRVRPSDVVPDNFASLAALAAYVGARI